MRFVSPALLVYRFIYASSVAAYGFHADNPIGMTGDWPIRPANRLFYAQEKAELEDRLTAESTAHPDVGLYVLRRGQPPKRPSKSDSLLVICSLAPAAVSTALLAASPPVPPMSRDRVKR